MRFWGKNKIINGDSYIPWAYKTLTVPHWRRVSSCGKWHFYNSSALSIATYTKPEMRKTFQDAELAEIMCGRRQEQLCSYVFHEILKLFIILQGWLGWCFKTWPLLVKVSTILFLRFLLSLTTFLNSSKFVKKKKKTQLCAVFLTLFCMFGNVINTVFRVWYITKLPTSSQGLSSSRPSLAPVGGKDKRP